MLHLRKSEERGGADHGWLKTRHSFSFADYYDPLHMSFRRLRVINQDVVAPKQGFPMHAHRDMEIVSVILRGTIQHKDSMGNEKLIRAGEIQRMSAGTGVRHSEFNPSASDEMELLQIWIEPAQTDLEPSYEQAAVPSEPNRLTLLLAPLGEKSPLHIHQDIRLWRGQLESGESLQQHVEPDRHVWLQLIEGHLRVNGLDVKAGDGLGISREDKVEIQAATAADFLYFDLN